METKEPKYTELTFQFIVESSPNAIVLANKEGKIAYVNLQTEKLFGYSKKELVGQFVEILIPERFSEKHPVFRNLFFDVPSERAMGGGRELFALRKNRTEFPIEIGLSPVITADGILVLASIIDITERKKAEEQFRLVVESAPNAMILVDHEGIITLVNDRTEKLFEYNRNELIGQKLEMLIPQRFRHHHPTHRGGFFEKPQTRSMGAGRDLFGLKKNGTEVQVEIGLNPIETKKGQIVLASIIDISERKTQEISLKKQLELEIKNKELEQFAYVASHDLQEPLRTVSNYIKVFEDDYATILDDTARNYLYAIRDATNRMSLLIKSLLDFSRLGRNTELTKTDCKKLLDNVLADLSILIKSSNATIEIADMPELHVYEIELGQVFRNLITNAIKFSKKNSSPSIRIYAKKIKDKWQFSVSDKGIGIAAIHFDRIFDIFQRLHTVQDYEGAGIGLANCKKIIQLHKGEIWLESTLNEGTTFYFSIPVDAGSILN
jgi:PAS domain S-box-containing protein